MNPNQIIIENETSGAILDVIVRVPSNGNQHDILRDSLKALDAYAKTTGQVVAVNKSQILATTNAVSAVRYYG